MTREGEYLDLEAIVNAFQNSSREISDRGLTKSLPQTAHVHNNWEAVRHALLPSEGGVLPAEADANLPYESGKISILRLSDCEFPLLTALFEVCRTPPHLREMATPSTAHVPIHP